MMDLLFLINEFFVNALSSIIHKAEPNEVDNVYNDYCVELLKEEGFGAVEEEAHWNVFA